MSAQIKSQIINFVPITDSLSTSGQPSEAELLALARDGYQVIVNLGLLDPRYALDDEAGLVEELGMGYHHIPVEFDAPTREELDRFVDAMQRAEGKKVHVHCAANYRVSVFVSLFAQLYLGWSARQADHFIDQVWIPNPIWKQFLEDCRLDLGVAA